MNLLMRKHLLSVNTLLIVLLSVSNNATGKNSPWNSWFLAQILTHPEIIAARESMNSSFSGSDAEAQPLYNPELGSAYESEGEFNNFQLSLTQKIDWWDKKAVRQLKGDANRLAAKSKYELILQQKLAETLSTLIDWQSANELARLAKQREQQLRVLLSIIDARKNAGDLSMLDAELALLGLSQRLNDTAEAIVIAKMKELQLLELLPGWTLKQVEIPLTFWDYQQETKLEVNASAHPNVVATKALWKVSQKNAKLIQLATKAEPTLGLSAGKQGGEKSVGLSFSIPLNIRNNFSHKVIAANKQVLSAESTYLDLLRKQKFAIKAADSTLQEYKIRYQQWKGLMNGGVESIDRLLLNQWENSDLSTAEYLLALQQRADGLSAGVALKTKYKKSYINWLLQIGQLKSVIKQL